MTLKEIQDKINEIQNELVPDNVWNDPEAHTLEDKLRDDFIKYITKRKDHLGKKAKLVLSTNDMSFGRWVE